jgi:hypothetical protein
MVALFARRLILSASAASRRRGVSARGIYSLAEKSSN